MEKKLDVNEMSNTENQSDCPESKRNTCRLYECIGVDYCSRGGFYLRDSSTKVPTPRTTEIEKNNWSTEGKDKGNNRQRLEGKEETRCGCTGS